jgi:hypothetical protein
MVEFPNRVYAGYLNQVPIACEAPGSVLQGFTFNVQYTDRKLWNNCVMWHGDVVSVRHDDWCEKDIGAGWKHDLTGARDNCIAGMGKGYCVYPPRFYYNWSCRVNQAEAKAERRICATHRTPEGEFGNVRDLSRFGVKCGDYQLLVNVKWVVSFVTQYKAGIPSVGLGYYEYYCCAFS